MGGLTALLPVLAGPALARARPVPADSLARPAPVLLGAYALGGAILNHSPYVTHLVASHPTGLELNAQRQLTGTQPWHGWYQYPQVGLALVYYDYHNPVLGRSYAATVYLSKPIIRTRRQQLSFRLGTGLAYFTQHYDLYTNRKNTFISTPLNATLQLRLDYDVALGPHWALLAGLGLSHYSNGGSGKPNYGINVPTLALGVNYHLARPLLPPATLAPNPPGLGTRFVDVSASLGAKQRSGGDPARYAVASVSVVVGQRLTRKSNLLLGLEGFVDRSLPATLRDTARDQSHLPDTKKIGLLAGHELLLGRLAVVTHLGVYVYSPYQSSTIYYERIGLKYMFTERLFGDIDLRLHRTVADVIECKLGWRLGRRVSRLGR